MWLFDSEGFSCDSLIVRVFHVTLQQWRFVMWLFYSEDVTSWGSSTVKVFHVTLTVRMWLFIRLFSSEALSCDTSTVKPFDINTSKVKWCLMKLHQWSLFENECWTVTYFVCETLTVTIRRLLCESFVNIEALSQEASKVKPHNKQKYLY